MQIKKMIKKIFTPPLEKEGFQELPTKESGVWTFGQPKENFYHLIQIQSQNMKLPSGHWYTINISLYTTAPFGASVGLAGILEDLPPEVKKNPGKYYSTDQQVEDYLTIAVKVILESALPLFDCLDRPRIHSRKEHHEKLAANTQERAEVFMKEHNLNVVDDVNGLKEMIRKTEAIIKEYQFVPLEEVSELLVNATAYWGELVRKVHGGEWRWNQFGEAYYLDKVGKYESEQSGGMESTFSYWIRPEIYCESIRCDYKELLHQLHIEDYCD